MTECKYIEVGGAINGSFRRNIICTTGEVSKHTAQFNNKDVYTTVYKYDTKNQDLANVTAPLYIDLDMDDIENNFDKLKKDLLLVYRQLKMKLYLKDEEIEIYFSGSKGFHIIVSEKVLNIKPCKNLNETYKLLALKLKSFTINKCIDTKIYDKKRLFRLPNTINSKTGLYKVSIELDKLKAMTYDEMKEYASTTKPTKLKLYKPNYIANASLNSWVEEIKKEEKNKINHTVAREFLKKKELLPCIKYILQNGASKGYRNNTANVLASALTQVGNDEATTLEIMQSWNAAKNNPPLPQKEVEITTLSAIKAVSEEKRYGCFTIRMLDLCVKNCPVHK